tara:strand:- start:3691 stop:4794 length:1104 start_codon:yes stop_codon:yes gene_type:complete
MKITELNVYQIDLPMKEGSYSWSNQSFTSFDSTVLEIKTNKGLSGYGEICPLGASYLPAYAEGARVGIKKLAESLFGQDPSNLNNINLLMDKALKGHPYVKSAIDVACWDILGKLTGQPIYNLLGGKLQDKVKLFKVISKDSPEAMKEKIIEYQEQGFRQFQMKVGEDPALDIKRINFVAERLNEGNILGADANCGWKQHEALRVVNAILENDIYLEQPCTTYEECLVIRQHTNMPMILDECIDSVHAFIRAYLDKSVDIINLKIGRMGGLTKSKILRDLCVSVGISMTIEDTWGSQIGDAAIAHLAHSTPEEFHFQSSAFHEYTTVVTAENPPKINNGYMSCNESPGLGILPNFEALGAPVLKMCP